MEPNKPKERSPWQPRVDQESELNPSVRTTLPEADLDDRTLEEVEDDPEPIKIVP